MSARILVLPKVFFRFLRKSNPRFLATPVVKIWRIRIAPHLRRDCARPHNTEIGLPKWRAITNTTELCTSTNPGTGRILQIAPQPLFGLANCKGKTLEYMRLSNGWLGMGLARPKSSVPAASNLPKSQALTRIAWRKIGPFPLRLRAVYLLNLGRGLPATHGKVARDDDEDHGHRRNPIGHCADSSGGGGDCVVHRRRGYHSCSRHR